MIVIFFILRLFASLWFNLYGLNEARCYSLAISFPHSGYYFNARKDSVNISSISQFATQRILHCYGSVLLRVHDVACGRPEKYTFLFFYVKKAAH